MRIESFAGCAISEREFSVRFTGRTMFDWPEHSHTSPTRMSFDVATAPDSARTLSVCGPPAAIAGNVASHRPFESARALAETPAMEAVTVSPGVLHPHTRTGVSRCNTE